MSFSKSTQIRDYIQTVRRIKSQRKPISFNTNRYENCKHQKHTKPAIFRQEVRFLGPVYLWNSKKNIAEILNNISKRSKSRKKWAKKLLQNKDKILQKKFLNCSLKTKWQSFSTFIVICFSNTSHCKKRIKR
jgi:hypothetical protein